MFLKVLNNLSELSGHLYQVKSSIWAGCVTYSKYFKKKKVVLETISQNQKEVKVRILCHCLDLL